MASHNQQNSNNHELVGHLALPNLTLNMVLHFRDETFGDIITPGYIVGGRIVRGLNVRGHNVRGRIVPVPLSTINASLLFFLNTAAIF
jgi:hypothetical protein